MDEFDFIKAFTDVDLLQVEAVGKVVGRTIGVLFKGMVEVGVSEEDAHRIIQRGMRELFMAMLPRPGQPT